MPNRFSTEAANADSMKEDAANASAEGMTDAIGADGTPRDREDRKPGPSRPAQPVATREGKAAADKAGEAKADDDAGKGEARPGQDINAAGFIKDKEAGKP